MKPLETLAITLLFPLSVTAASAASDLATGVGSFAPAATEAPQEPAPQPEPEIRRHRDVTRVHSRDGKPVVWSFGHGGPRGYLGVGVIQLTPELREHFGAPADRGVMVSKVVEDSPAAIAGIAAGDILLAVDDEAIDGEWDLIREIGQHGEGDTVSIEVQRDGTTFSVTPALDERDRQVVDLMPLLQRAELKKRLRQLHELQEMRVEVPEIDVEVPEIDVEAIEQVIAIREKDIERAMRDLEKRLNSPEFRERLAEAARHSAELERRTAELERRLAELQRRLDRLQAERNP